MHIAIPVESTPGEPRVAATPDTIKKWINNGHSVSVHRGAGIASALPDASYAEVGATLHETRASALKDADLLLKVRAPQLDEIAELKSGASIIAMFDPFRYPHLDALAARQLNAFALELLPRSTRAQSMDVLSSQANIAGYRAVLLALQYYPRFMPMLMTAAGTVKPARVMIIGAGVAGLQAIATAKRLGAIVEAFDVRQAAKEQVESLGAKFIEVPLDKEEQAAAGGVYAQQMSAAYLARQAAKIDQHARLADIIITTAQIPGKTAPCLLTAPTVEAMKAGAVIVDLAADSGGNCALTRANEVWVSTQGVTLVGTSNIAGLLAADASKLYAKNMLNFVDILCNANGALEFNLADELVAATLLTHEGHIRFRA